MPLAWAQRQVAYLLAADIVSGPLPIRLREVNQPMISTRNRVSTPRPCLLTGVWHTEPPNNTIINPCRFLDCLWLGPRWHPQEQHLLQRPDMIGESGRHRRRARPPYLGRAHTVGRDRLGQWLA
jgi:hypothetical protein